MKKLLHWPLAFCVCLLSASLAHVQAAPPKKRVAVTVIPNCIGSDKISFHPGRNGAMLDLEDRVHVAAAIVARYPMMERDGFYPSGVALWRRPEGDWVYATLVAKEDAPHPSCYTSNVTAGNVSLTPTLLKKYFGITPEPL